MAAQPQIDPQLIISEAPRTRWSRGVRIAFRFCFLYFGLYCATTQVLSGMLPIPDTVIEIPLLSVLPPIKPLVFWTAAHVFGVSTPLVFTGSGSGDKTFDWVLAFCALVFAVLATAAWSAVDRKRESYVSLHKWFHLFLRFALGSQMLIYGMMKAVPLQMPFPSLTRLLKPYGQFSPMGVIWSSIGASPGYEIFIGAAEMLGGLLLFFPRTATFGALVCLADAAHVFMINMTYDVPVKLLSFHLILMSLVLLAPELRRISSFFFSDRVVAASTHPKLFRTARGNRIALLAQVVFGLLLIGANGYGVWTGWRTYGGGAPQSPLYGIWNVEQLSRDGDVRPPLMTDNDRWRRVVFERSFMAFQRPDDNFLTYAAAIDAKLGSIALSKRGDTNWKANFRFQRAGQDRLTLDGEMDGHKYQMQLQLFDRNKLLLVSRGFHWIQEYPFNR